MVQAERLRRADQGVGVGDRLDQPKLVPIQASISCRKRSIALRLRDKFLEGVQMPQVDMRKSKR